MKTDNGYNVYKLQLYRERWVYWKKNIISGFSTSRPSFLLRIKSENITNSFTGYIYKMVTCVILTRIPRISSQPVSSFWLCILY